VRNINVRSVSDLPRSGEKRAKVEGNSAGLRFRFRIFAGEYAKKYLAHAVANEIIGP